jgi:hypothetical protein
MTESPYYPAMAAFDCGVAGILIDLGIVSILIIDMAATDAAWKTYPLSYSVNPICPAPQSAPSATPTPSASQS